MDGNNACNQILTAYVEDSSRFNHTSNAGPTKRFRYFQPYECDGRPHVKRPPVQIYLKTVKSPRESAVEPSKMAHCTPKVYTYQYIIERRTMLVLGEI